MGEEFYRINKPKLSPIGSSVIPIVIKLQHIFAPLVDLLSKIKLPQVAVIGSQSSGKSSVLEALVGRDFLPRGSDICTRRPHILQLENRSGRSGEDDGREWGEFLHRPTQFYDISAIRKEIQDINQNRSIAEALASEENFFHNHPVYHGLLDRYGVPQLAKKLNLVRLLHIPSFHTSYSSDCNSEWSGLALGWQPAVKNTS